MIWFGNPLLFISIYGPAALAGLLLPFARHRRLPKLPDLLLGVGLAEALIAATLTAFNGRSGFMSAAWAVTCLGAAVAVSFQVISCESLLANSIFWFWGPLYLTLYP